jgi:OmcA/MtrC family decaheme c-type cytochrome
MKRWAHVGAVAFAVAVVGAGLVGAACTGPEGPPGEAATEAGVGPAGEAGPPGPAGSSGGTDGGVKAPYNPGLDLKLSIDSTTIDATQTATVTFLLTDANKVPVTLPLTSDGRIGGLAGSSFTADQVSISFVLSWLDGTAAAPGYYTPYTLRTVDGGAPKAATDSGGKFAASPKGDGYYTYTLGTKIAVDAANATKTHTVGAYAVRTVPGVATPYVANAEFNFLPAGGAVTVTRELVLRENCNGCHSDLGHHGAADNARKDIQLCILCHSPATTDVATGNTINFGTMIHKLHSGANLPSVTEKNPDGTPVFPYGIGSNDYSDVTFPQDLGNCAKCHAGAKDGLAAGATIVKNPTFEACTSCHDRTYFGAAPPVSPVSTKWTPHKLGSPVDPSQPAACTPCHKSGAFADPALYHNAKTTGVALKIISAKFTSAPGSALQVVFDLAVTDYTAIPPVTTHGDPSQLGVWAAVGTLTSGSAISIILGGPTDDFAFGHNQNNRFNVFSGRIPAAAVNGTLSGPDAVTKYLTFTTTRADFDTTLPGGKLTGSWGVGITGTAQAPPRSVAGVPTARPRYFAPNDVYYFNAADGLVAPPPTPIVEAARCNTCHEQIPGHGGSRNDPRLCQLCHQPSQAGTGKPGNLAPVVGSTAEGSPVDFKYFIHAIHLGGQRTPGNTLWYGGTDFTSLAQYPDKLNNCQHCHLPGTYGLPQVAPTSQPTQSVTFTCTAASATTCTTATSTDSPSAPTFMGPNTAVCTACHDAPSTKAHAQLMTVNAGASAPMSATNPTGYAESCETCHGKGRPYDVVNMHVLR